MNERIKELAVASELVCNDNGKLLTGWLEQVDLTEYVEKFAELIVRECLYNMENCDGDLDFAIWKTKQDFGVKE